MWTHVSLVVSFLCLPFCCLRIPFSSNCFAVVDVRTRPSLVIPVHMLSLVFPYVGWPGNQGGVRQHGPEDRRRNHREGLEVSRSLQCRWLCCHLPVTGFLSVLLPLSRAVDSACSSSRWFGAADLRIVRTMIFLAMFLAVRAAVPLVVARRSKPWFGSLLFLRRRKRSLIGDVLLNMLFF